MLATLALALGPAWSADLLPIARPETVGVSTDGLERLSSFMRKATDANGYLGAVTLIARRGAVVDWRSYGTRDLARTDPMPKDAIFRIYSMTKTIATVAAMILVEEGRLALDEPIAKHLPEFRAMQVFDGGSADAPKLRPAASPITLRHLLTHTAGFATGGAGFEEPTKLLEQADLHGSADLADFSWRVARLPLAIDPGLRFAYDGTSIEVVSRLVEVASGMPFDAFVQRRVLAPLGMRDTGFTVPADSRDRIVDITAMGPEGRIVLDDGRTARRPGERMQNYASGAGGLYSTAPDYLRFCEMLLEGGKARGQRGDTIILHHETVETMMRDQLSDGVSPAGQLNSGEGFGLGGSVVIDPSRRDRAGSPGAYGWSGAASTYYTIDPKQRLIAILMMQHVHRANAQDLPKLSTRFYDLVYQALDR